MLQKSYKDGGEELSSLATLKKQNDQLQASLEEAHKELRKMQNGYSLDKIVVTSDVKEILIKTYRAEKRKSFLNNIKTVFI